MEDFFRLNKIMVVSPLQPLSKILATPVTKEDLSEIESCVIDEKFLESIENAWSDFLEEHSELMPQGQREQRIVTLQQKAAEVEASKENVEKELRKQTAFFRSSREELEKVYSIKMQDAMQRQRIVHEELSKKLDAIISADSIQQQTLPWLHFVKELDTLASSRVVQQQQHRTPSNVSSSSELSTPTKQFAKPSSRAMFLTELAAAGAPTVEGYSTSTVVFPSVKLSTTHTAQQLRAYRLDHALLRTNVCMLLKEIEWYETLIDSQPTVGKFLTENDVWSILKSDSYSVANSTVSAVTLPSHVVNKIANNGGDGSGK